MNISSKIAKSPKDSKRNETTYNIFTSEGKEDTGNSTLKSYYIPSEREEVKIPSNLFENTDRLRVSRRKLARRKAIEDPPEVAISGVSIPHVYIHPKGIMGRLPPESNLFVTFDLMGNELRFDGLNYCYTSRYRVMMSVQVLRKHGEFLNTNIKRGISRPNFKTKNGIRYKFRTDFTPQQTCDSCGQKMRGSGVVIENEQTIWNDMTVDLRLHEECMSDHLENIKSVTGEVYNKKEKLLKMCF